MFTTSLDSRTPSFPSRFFLIGLVVNGRQGWILPWLCVLRPERFARPGCQLLKQAQQPPFSDKPELVTLAHRRRSCIHILQALLLHTGNSGKQPLRHLQNREQSRPCADHCENPQGSAAMWQLPVLGNSAEHTLRQVFDLADLIFIFASVADTG